MISGVLQLPGHAGPLQSMNSIVSGQASPPSNGVTLI